MRGHLCLSVFDVDEEATAFRSSPSLIVKDLHFDAVTASHSPWLQALQTFEHTTTASIVLGVASCGYLEGGAKYAQPKAKMLPLSVTIVTFSVTTILGSLPLSQCKFRRPQEM